MREAKYLFCQIGANQLAKPGVRSMRENHGTAAIGIGLVENSTGSIPGLGWVRKFTNDISIGDTCLMQKFCRCIKRRTSRFLC